MVVRGIVSSDFITKVSLSHQTVITFQATYLHYLRYVVFPLSKILLPNPRIKNRIFKNSSIHIVEEKEDSRYMGTHVLLLESEISSIVVVKSPNFGTRLSGVKNCFEFFKL